jgi:hypothetical protein
MPSWLTPDIFTLLSIRSGIDLFFVWQPARMGAFIESLKLIRTNFFKGGTDKTFWFQWSKHRLHLVVEHASALMHLDLHTCESNATSTFNDLDDAPNKSLCFGVIGDYFLTRLQMLDPGYPAVVGFDASQHMLCFIQGVPLAKCIEVTLLEATELPAVTAPCIDILLYRRASFMSFISQNPDFHMVYDEKSNCFLLQAHDIVHGNVTLLYGISDERVERARIKEQIRLNKFEKFQIALKATQLEILPKLTVDTLLPHVKMGLYMPPPTQCGECKGRLEQYHEENAWLELSTSSRANSCCVRSIRDGPRGNAFFLRFHATNEQGNLQMRLWTPAIRTDDD